MREIKFRRAHFRHKDGQFDHFSYWGPIKGGFQSPATHSHCFYKEGTDQQFVGIQDKNGKEIYVDDIVVLWLVKNDTITSYFAGKVTDHGYNGMTIDTKSDYMEFCLKNYEYEAIGNIHENPDFLK